MVPLRKTVWKKKKKYHINPNIITTLLCIFQKYYIILTCQPPFIPSVLASEVWLDGKGILATNISLSSCEDIFVLGIIPVRYLVTVRSK